MRLRRKQMTSTPSKVRWTINRVSRDIDVVMESYIDLEDALSAFSDDFNSDRWIFDVDHEMVIVQVIGEGREWSIVYCVCPVKLI
jgi:hypothetical protein